MDEKLKEKRMKLFAKITSILSIMLLIFTIFYSFVAWISISERLLLFGALIFYFLFFTFPLLYFAFSKESNNKFIKIWARIITIILPVLIIFRSIVSSTLSLSLGFVDLFLLSPLYYYGWFRNSPQITNLS